MLENPTTDSSSTVKRYAPPNQRNRSIGRRKSGGDFVESRSLYNKTATFSGTELCYAVGKFIGRSSFLSAILEALNDVPCCETFKAQVAKGSLDPRHKAQDKAMSQSVNEYRLERASSYGNDGEKNQAASLRNVPIMDHADPPRLIGLQGCCSSEAYQLLNNRWAAAINAYENPSTDLSDDQFLMQRKHFLLETSA
ncbi:hypothetical protein Tco_1243955 [Tanacetum coccineum]